MDSKGANLVHGKDPKVQAVLPPFCKKNVILTLDLPTYYTVLMNSHPDVLINAFLEPVP